MPARGVPEKSLRPPAGCSAHQPMFGTGWGAPSSACAGRRCTRPGTRPSPACAPPSRCFPQTASAMPRQMPKSGVPARAFSTSGAARPLSHSAAMPSAKAPHARQHQRPGPAHLFRRVWASCGCAPRAASARHTLSRLLRPVIYHSHSHGRTSTPKGRKALFQALHRLRAIVQGAGRRHGGRARVGRRCGVFGAGQPARGHHRTSTAAHTAGNQLCVHAAAAALGVHAGQQYLARCRAAPPSAAQATASRPECSRPLSK